MEFPNGDAASAIYPLCAAGSLTAPEAEAITVTATGKDGEVLPGWRADVVGGKLVVINPHPHGTVLIVN